MAILKNYDNLSDNEKVVVDSLKTALVDVNPAIVVTLINSTIMLSRLVNILELRTDIREYDRQYISGQLSADAWKSAEEDYDPMAELANMFGVNSIFGVSKGDIDEQDK